MTIILSFLVTWSNYHPNIRGLHRELEFPFTNYPVGSPCKWEWT